MIDFATPMALVMKIRDAAYLQERDINYLILETLPLWWLLLVFDLSQL